MTIIIDRQDAATHNKSDSDQKNRCSCFNCQDDCCDCSDLCPDYENVFKVYLLVLSAVAFHASPHLTN
jgi:hypothetical protein